MEIRGLDQPLEALEFHDDVIVQTLEGDAGNVAHQVPLGHRHNVNILRADNHIHRLVGRKALVHALEDPAKEFDPVIFQHDAVQDVAFADEVRHKGVLGLIVYIFGFADLLDTALVHHHNGIGHGQRFLLIVGHINKGNAHCLLDPFQFVLHILAQTQIQCTQRLVQKQYLGAVHQRAGNGNPLLLTAG